MADSWALRFGGTGADQGTGVALDGDGNIVIVGVFEGTIDMGGGPLVSAGLTDMVIAKFTPGGVHLWSVSFGGSGHEVATCVALDANDNIFVGGYVIGTADLGGGPLLSAGANDMFVAKYTSTGTYQWAKRFGGSSVTANDAVNSLAVDASGNVIFTGVFMGNRINFGGIDQINSGSGQNAFLVKLAAADGSQIWSKDFASGASQGTKVAIHPGGDIFLLGWFANYIDCTKVAVSDPYPPTTLVTAGVRDLYIARFQPDGTHLWSQRYGGASEDSATELAFDSVGNFYVLGSFTLTMDLGTGPMTAPYENGSDLFLAKFDSDGTALWSKHFPGFGGSESGTGLAVDSDGNVSISGNFAGNINIDGQPLTSSSTDVFVAKFSPAGDCLWAGRFGGAGFDSSADLAVDSTGHAIITGFFQETTDFGGQTLTSAGSLDIFLCRVSAIPPPPTDLAVNRNSITTYTLSWTAAAGALGEEMVPIATYPNDSDPYPIPVIVGNEYKFVTGPFEGIDIGDEQFSPSEEGDFIATESPVTLLHSPATEVSASLKEYYVRGYRIYRDDVLLAEIHQRNSSYEDTPVTTTPHSYSVSSVDGDGVESARVTWYGALNVVSSMSLAEVSDLSDPFAEPIIPGHCSNVFITWGQPPDADAGPEIVGGGTYSAGIKVVAVIPGKMYHFIKGANDTSLVNGTETWTTSIYFRAQGATVTLNGAGAVTAVIKTMLVQTYRVYRDRTIIYEMPATEHQDQQPIVDPDRSELTFYTYRVDAIDTAGGIASSPLAAVLMPECTPTGYPVQFGSHSSDSPKAATVDSSDNIVVGGNLFGGLSTLLYLAKLNSSAVVQWINYIPYNATGASPIITSIKTDSSGNVFIAVQFSGRINFGDSDGWIEGTLHAQTYVLKYNAAGVLQFKFRKEPVEGRGDFNCRLQIATSGNIFLCGLSLGQITGSSSFVHKYNSLGVLQWRRHFISGADSAVATSMVLDASEDVHVCGNYSATFNSGCSEHETAPPQGTKIILTKISGVDGTCIWARDYGESVIPYGGSRGDVVAIDSQGNHLVAGLYGIYGHAGGGDLPNAGVRGAMFVAKYGPTGDHIWSKGFYSDNSPTIARVFAGQNDTALVIGLLDFGRMTFNGVLSSGFPASGFIMKLSSAGDELSLTRMFNSIYGGELASSNQLMVAGQVATESKSTEVVIDLINQ